jgi:hypothetical protein
VSKVTSKLQIERSRRGQYLAALVCLLLTLTAAIGEVTHTHLKAEASNSPIRCSLCVAAHSAKPAPVCQPIHAVRIFAALVLLQSPMAGSRLATSGLFIRPPPTQPV